MSEAGGADGNALRSGILLSEVGVEIVRSLRQGETRGEYGIGSCLDRVIGLMIEAVGSEPQTT